jgi:Ni,Fe-hydrogenase maturation factor
MQTKNKKIARKAGGAAKAKKTRKRTVFVFGNPLVKGDSAALAAAKILKNKMPGFNFKEASDPDFLPWLKGKELLIMDTAEGIEKTEFLCGLENLRKAEGAFSLHDFDLQFQLQLLKKMGKLESVKIIAIPAGCDAEKAAAETEALLRKTKKR